MKSRDFNRSVFRWRAATVILLASCMTFSGAAEAAKPVGGGGGGGGGGKTKSPAISVDPSSLPFGNQAVGTASTPQSASVRNSGRADLVISDISKSGSGAAAFAYTSGCIGTFAPGASCSISVTFTPGATGPFSASLVITSNASNAPTSTIALSGNGTQAVAAVRRIEGAGDSIMRGYNASCTGNTNFWHLLCYAGGDQPENSFLDGSSSSVTSLVDRYIALDPQVTGGKAASESGSEMKDQTKNNFETQANAIVNAATQPARVFVELGGNDICNRATTTDLYTDGEWETAVRAGLNRLVNGLPDGSTVLMVSVPRVQDLRAVGIAKQTSTSDVNCENFWASYDVCRIATAGGTDLDTRLNAINTRQQAYNALLVTLAAEYNARAGETGVEVVADYDVNANASVGSYSFQPEDINGGDCFHPSVLGQNKLSEIIWSRNPHK